MATLSIENLTKRFGSNTVVDDVSLDVAASELVAVLGPSGCGKTTLLRMVAGFVDASGGRIVIDGKDVTNAPPHTRETGMVFQSYALFPHMSVAENVAFGLEMRKASKADIRDRVAAALRMVRLEALSDRYPRQISGGQQQRVAIARALVIRPSVFLLDEPLSNLDAKLRQSVGLEIRGLQQELGLTTVFVTHDQNEALSIADRLVLLNAGRVEQSGTAIELYGRPKSVFVANFLGHANLLSGSLADNRRFVCDGGISVVCEQTTLMPASRTTLCIRPENVEVGVEAQKLKNYLVGEVGLVTYLGAVTELVVRVAGIREDILVHRQNRPGSVGEFKRGDRIDIGWQPSTALVLSDG